MASNPVAWMGCSAPKLGKRCSRFKDRGNCSRLAGRTRRRWSRLHSGDVRRAIADFDEAARLDPTYAPAYRSRALAYYGKHDYARAAADLSRAIELEPDNALSFYARGLARYSLRDFDRAIADYSEAIRIDPYYAFAYGNRARAYRSLGDLDQAVADFNRSLEIDPSNANDFNGRGAVYLDRQAYTQAIADFDDAIRLDPKFSLALSNRCWARGLINDQLQQALADCNAAVDLNPNPAPLQTVPLYISESARLAEHVGTYQPDCGSRSSVILAPGK